MEVGGQLHDPVALPPGKDPRYPLDKRLNGTQSRSGTGGLKVYKICIFKETDIINSD
jgi:hypothetical protein